MTGTTTKGPPNIVWIVGIIGILIFTAVQVVLSISRASRSPGSGMALAITLGLVTPVLFVAVLYYISVFRQRQRLNAVRSDLPAAFVFPGIRVPAMVTALAALGSGVKVGENFVVSADGSGIRLWMGDRQARIVYEVPPHLVDDVRVGWVDAGNQFRAVCIDFRDADSNAIRTLAIVPANEGIRLPFAIRNQERLEQIAEEVTRHLTPTPLL